MNDRLQGEKLFYGSTVISSNFVDKIQTSEILGWMMEITHVIISNGHNGSMIEAINALTSAGHHKLCSWHSENSTFKSDARSLSCLNQIGLVGDDDSAINRDLFKIVLCILMNDIDNLLYLFRNRFHQLTTQFNEY